MDMNEILSDEPVDKTEVVIEAPENKAEPDADHDYRSRRDRAREKEAVAQGKVRDPNTGQFVSPEKVEKVETKTETKVETKPEEKPVEKVEVKTEIKPETKTDELTPKEKAAFAKAADETRKRQALEARLRELEAKVQATPKEPEKAFWDDPEAALKKHQQEMQAVAINTRIQTSETIARSRHPDFDEKMLIFAEIAKDNPALGYEVMRVSDPAEFVYKTAKNHQELKEAGGIEALREKITKEAEVKIRAQLEAELKAKHEALEKERAALPGSLSEAPSKGGNRVVWNGPTSFNDILGLK